MRTRCLPVNLSHLVKVEFAREHYHVGKACVELQCLYVAYVELRGEVHLHPKAVAIGHHRHVAGYHGCYACLARGVDYCVHCGDVLTVDYGVHREIALYAVCGAYGGDVAQVGYGEVVCRVRPHVELFHTEVNRPRACLYGSRQTLPRAHGSHYLEFADCMFHIV